MDGLFDWLSDLLGLLAGFVFGILTCLMTGLFALNLSLWVRMIQLQAADLIGSCRVKSSGLKVNLLNHVELRAKARPDYFLHKPLFTRNSDNETKQDKTKQNIFCF